MLVVESEVRRIQPLDLPRLLADCPLVWFVTTSLAAIEMPVAIVLRSQIIQQLKNALGHKELRPEGPVPSRM
jgi:hypothetical protein